MLSFLRRHHPEINEEDILAIFRRLNLTSSGRITFDEFSSFFAFGKNGRDLANDSPLRNRENSRSKRLSSRSSSKKFSQTQPISTNQNPISRSPPPQVLVERAGYTDHKQRILSSTTKLYPASKRERTPPKPTDLGRKADYTAREKVVSRTSYKEARDTYIHDKYSINKTDSSVKFVQPEKVENKDLLVFLDMIKKILVFSEKIEDTQQTLFTTSGVNLHHLFRVGDEEAKGALTMTEMSKLLAAFGVSLTIPQIVKMFSLSLKVKKSESSVLSFSDFMSFFAPIGCKSQINMFNSFMFSKNQAMNASISLGTAELLKLIIELQLKKQEELEISVTQMGKRAAERIANEVGKGKSGEIFWDDFSTCLNNAGIRYFPSHIMYLFREFSADNFLKVDLTSLNDLFTIYSTNFN